MIRQYLAFIIFILGSILLGENYPFTKFPMYNGFPNYSYVFYVSDTNNKPIASKDLRIEGFDLAHNYFAIANAHHFPNGKNLETPNHLSKIGKEMAQIIRQKNPGFKGDFQIHRIYFCKENQQLKKEDRVIFTSRTF